MCTKVILLTISCLEPSATYVLCAAVTGATDCGLLEGVHRAGGSAGEAGLFPVHCVQEVRLRQNLVPPPALPVHRRVVGRRESNATSLKHFATAPRHKKQSVTVVKMCLESNYLDINNNFNFLF